jgi:hypothetical protein
VSSRYEGGSEKEVQEHDELQLSQSCVGWPSGEDLEDDDGRAMLGPVYRC